MSKRKGSTIHRQSKRQKGNNYHHDGKTQLQREMELLEEAERQKQQEEYYEAQQELDAQNSQQSNHQTLNNIQMGTPLSDDDEDDDVLDDEEDDYNQENNHPNNIRDGGDSDSDYAEHQESSHHHNDYSSSSHQSKQPPTNSHQQRKREELTLRDLRSAQMKRDQLEKICTEPYFASFVGRSFYPDPNDNEFEIELPGLFCRIWIGTRQTSSGKQAAVYRICEMLGVQDYRRTYLLTNNKTSVNVGLLVTHGLQKRVFKVIQASNSPFTQQEFDQWKQQMKMDGQELPSKDELAEAYLNAMKMHKNFKYDKTQIEILKKNKAKNYNAKTLANPHKEKLKIVTLVSGLTDDDPQRHKLVIYLNDINKEIERRNSISSQAVKVSIASINEKNKIKNKKLMIKAREKERRLALAMRGKKKARDPFTRAITAPQIESFNKTAFLDEDEEAKKKKKEEEEKKKKELEEQLKRKRIKREDEELKNLSILEEHKRKKIKKRQNRSLNDNEDDDGGLLYDDNNHNIKDSKNGGVLIKNDGLWNVTVHEIAKDFVNKCSDITFDGYDVEMAMMIKQPQFGRNTNKSKYAFRYTQKPDDLRIISIDEYLQKHKYDAQ